MSSFFFQLPHDWFVTPVRCTCLHVNWHMEDPARWTDQDYQTQYALEMKEADPLKDRWQSSNAELSFLSYETESVLHFSSSIFSFIPCTSCSSCLPFWKHWNPRGLKSTFWGVGWGLSCSSCGVIVHCISNTFSNLFFRCHCNINGSQPEIRVPDTAGDLRLQLFLFWAWEVIILGILNFKKKNNNTPSWVVKILYKRNENAFLVRI